MDRNVDYNSEQKAPDNATATRSSPFMARPVPAVEPKAMDFEAWRVETPDALTTSPPNRQIRKMRRLDVSRERVALLASR
jgi:hypothetical protein